MSKFICIRYTAPDNTTEWTPVVVSRDGCESEFKVVDPEGIPKNVSFQLLHGTPCLCTSYGPSSQAFIRPLQREQGLKLILS